MSPTPPSAAETPPAARHRCGVHCTRTPYGMEWLRCRRRRCLGVGVFVRRLPAIITLTSSSALLGRLVAATQSLLRGVAAGASRRLARLWCWACVRLCHYLLAHIFSSNDKRIDDERTYAARYVSGKKEEAINACSAFIILWICKWGWTIENIRHLSIYTHAGNDRHAIMCLTKLIKKKSSMLVRHLRNCRLSTSEINFHPSNHPSIHPSMYLLAKFIS